MPHIVFADFRPWQLADLTIAKQRGDIATVVRVLNKGESLSCEDYVRYAAAAGLADHYIEALGTTSPTLGALLEHLQGIYQAKDAQ